jgi:BirA family transcriptional regulator, biotin operon repressor / biotin---[acetyl-CoA-carboxylase] ligase
MKDSASVKKIEQLAKTLHLDTVKKILVFDSVESTNRTAKTLAANGEKEGTVVVANTQTHGRGRFDRIWQSPKGGLYLSLILRPTLPAENIPLLPLVTAVALATTIESYGLHTTIKWPNDVQVNGKKIAGILLESEGKEHSVDFVVVGIGVNLNTRLTKLSADIQKHSTSLRDELSKEVEYHEFLETFFTQFDTTYNQFKGKHFEFIIQEWKHHSDTLGRTIRVQTATGLVQGTAQDIDASGFLLLRTTTGKVKKIMSGDCFYFDESDHI